MVDTTDIAVTAGIATLTAAIPTVITMVVSLIVAVLPLVVIGLIIYVGYRWWTSRPEYLIHKHATDRITQKLTSW